MTHGKRLYMDFDDDLGNTWTVEIYHKDFGGVATELAAMGDPPFMLRYNGDKEKVIIGSEATVTIVGTDDMSWIDTSVGDDIKIILKLEGVTKWTGFAVAGQYVDEYRDTTRFLTITANDRIGMLDNVKYQTFDDPPVKYTGYEVAIIQVARVLAHTNILQNIRVCDNLFESTMNVADTDDPYAQFSVNQDLWLDTDQNAGMCSQVLNQLLGSRECRIFQADGQWVIQRKPEISAAVTYRIFTYAGVYASNSSIVLDKTTEDDLVMMGDGEVNYTDGWKNRILNINYGLKQSLITGHWFEDGMVDKTDLTSIEGWSNNGGWKWAPMNAVGYMWCKTVHWVDRSLAVNIRSPRVNVSGSFKHKLSIVCGLDQDSWAVAPNIRVHVLWRSKASPLVVKYWKVDGEDSAWADFNDMEESDTSVIEFPVVDGPDALSEITAVIGEQSEAGDMEVLITTPWRGFGSLNDSTYYFTGVKISRLDIDADTGEKLGAIAGTSFEWVITDEEYQSPDPFELRISEGLMDRTLFDYYNGWIKVGAAYTSALWYLKGTNPITNSQPLVAIETTVGGSFRTEIYPGWLLQGWYEQYSTAVKKYIGSIYGLASYQNTIVLHELGDIRFIWGDAEYDVLRAEWNGSLFELKASSSPGLKTSSGIIKSLLWKNQDEAIKMVGSGSGSSNGVPFDGIRSGTVNLSPGANSISFSHGYPDGTSLQIKEKVVNTGGELIGSTISGITMTGFVITVNEASVLEYLVIKNL